MFAVMKSKSISVTDYAKSREITRAAVLKQIKYGRHLPGVKSYEKVGNTWILKAEA